MFSKFTKKRVLTTLFLLTITNFVLVAQVAPVVTDETFNIDENTFASIPVGTVTATDADGDVLSYAITAGNTDNAFSIDNAGIITVNNSSALDFETNPSFSLTIEVTDDEVPAQVGTGTITIDLIDISPNDFCTNAITINCGTTVAGTTTDATTDEAIASNCGSNLINDGSVGVWYQFVGNGETITLSTCDDADYDTSIGVYSGSCTTGLTCVAGNDDGDGCSGFSSFLNFNSVLNEDYYILIDGYEDNIGDFNLTITCNPTPPPPANDNCTGAEALIVFAAGTGTPSDGTNVDATNYTQVVDCDEYANINDVWYSFNSGPNTQIDVTASLTTAGYLYYALYETCGAANLGCNSSGSTSPSFSVNPNTDYLLQLWNSNNDQGTFSILINDGPNTAPSVTNSTVSLSRFSALGDIAETVTATDAEGHDQSFEITGGNVEGIFDIDPASGEITVFDETILQASATTSFDLTVQVNDLGPGSLFSTAIVTINIIDNEFPAVSDEALSIDENTANATIITTVAATDNDGDNLSYAIISGNTNSAFAIDAIGEITVLDMNQLNYEINPVFELEVEVTDDGPLTLSEIATITVNLNDINEAPVVLSGGSLNLSQYTPNGTTLGFLEFTDDDIDQNHTFAITNGNTNNIFGIDPVTGEGTIVNDTDLLANGATTYVVTVEVTDNGNPAQTGSADFTINIFDNEAPVIAQATFNVDENSANGTPVGTVAATDAEGNGIVFSIVFGNDLGAFSINAGGDIQVSDFNVLDLETNPTFELLIEAQDDGPGSIAGYEYITIDLNNINETPVVGNLTFNMSSLSPDGYIIGNVDATDPESDALSFSIIAGNNDGIFDIDGTTGDISVLNGALLNPATAPQHTLTVQADDTEFSPTATVTINVFGNEFPTFIATAFSIDENASELTLIGTITSDDVDGIALFEIISGNDNNQFSIDGATGDLTVNTASEFDFETNQAFDIVIRITDDGLGNLMTSETVTITINDVNEFAPAVNSLVNSLDENSANGTVAATITASDDDIFQSLSYAITGGNTNNAFVIDNSGIITVNDVSILDFETNASFTLTVDVSDNGIPVKTTQTMLTIDLNDVNEAPILVTNIELRVNLAEAGTITNTSLQVTDPDNTPAEIIYEISIIPQNGTLQKDGTTLAVNDTFTQADIDNGIISYNHNGLNWAADKFSFSVTDGLGGTIATSDFNIAIGIVSGIGSDNAKYNIALYPNPVQSAVEIRLENDYTGDVQIKLIDVTGKVWNQLETSKKNTLFNIPIDVSSLPKGIIIIEVKMDTSVIRNRIIKK